MIFLPLLLTLLAADTPATGLPIDVLPKQALPAKGCAAYLFLRGGDAAAPPTFLAMASADPAQLRLSIDGAVMDVARSGQTGDGGFGFAGVTDYAGNGVTAVLDMTIETRPDISGGAVVKDATLRIDRAGRDGVVLPVAGIIGCAPA